MHKPQTNEKGDVLKKRIVSLQNKLSKRNLDAFLVSNTENKFHLTGWSADSESGYLLITGKENFLFTDSRYTEQAVSQVKNFKLIELNGGFAPFLADFAKEKKIKRLGFESHDISVFALRRFKEFVKVRWIPIANLIEEFRAVKDETEIEKIRRAVAMDEEAFNHILKTVRVGMTESEIAWELEKKLKELGAEKMAWFPFIVAAGKNSSIPHYGNNPKVKIKKGDILQLDFASVVDGYHSDTSRVIFIGKPSSEQVKVYNWVWDAQKLGQSLVKKGVQGDFIDRKVRDWLRERTPFYFKHGLGHGVGLQVHELPKISENGKKKLEIGNCFTIEPGIYQPGWSGVRLEDIVVTTKNGCEILTKTTKDIKEVTV